ncbi:protein D2 [Leptinotarsa decemlineata]|uniref:protein D2 n=1 Tax=Leptinotarsa decemlineata TaxID=7539 RepID=UPI000C2518E9|nr:protein D2-like [Leptinotarsa decemlineata]
MFKGVINNAPKFLKYPNSRNYTMTSISKGWYSKKIVPDVIDQPPTGKLVIEYPDVSIHEGYPIVYPSQVKEPPEVYWKVREHGVYCTLCMLDPDAPSRRKNYLGEWLHWLVGNIADYQVDRGDILAEYIGAGPPRGTGLHRYIFLLYKQPSKMHFNETKLTNQYWKGREKFSMRKFALKYKLGVPYAGNYFEAEYDEYVDELHKQLKLK